jgi:formylglycine-generating enzyme required for sulfatase activity
MAQSQEEVSMQRFVVVVLVVALLAGLPASGGAPLTKEDLILLLKNGFAEDLILEKIRTAGVGFESTATEMVELKRAGATDAVLRALIEAVASPAASGSSRSAADAPADGMVFIPAGAFTMGLGREGEDSSPEHSVYLDAFYIDRHEVTNLEYERFDKDHRRHSASDCDRCPVTNVNWLEAAAYARGAGKRLPTEAEWERAARGPEGFLFGHGNDYRPDRARLGARGAVSVGSYPPNGYGIFDVLGNVWEWCADYWGKDYYRQSPERNPKGPANGPGHVMRGGSFRNDRDVHLATRSWSRASYRYRGVGFRCARDGPRAGE